MAGRGGVAPGPPWVGYRGGCWNRPRLAGVFSLVLGDARQAAGPALADGAELPLGAVAVELAEDHRGLRRGVLGEVVACDLGVVGRVDDADERVAHLAEALAAAVGVVDRDGED